MPSQQIAVSRADRDFVDFVNYADSAELALQRELIADQLDTQFRNMRSPLVDLMQQRLAILEQTLALEEAA